jgi:hypothetical protein
MILQPGEVVLIRMAFHQASGSKVRPALAIFDSGDDDFIAAPVTSQLRKSEYDLAFIDWRAADLNVASSVRLHKLAVLEKFDVVRSLGLISAPDHESLYAILCRMFCPR